MRSSKFSDSLLVEWRCSESSKDSGKRIDALIAEKRLLPARVALAAALMHPGARASSVPPVRLAGGFRERLVLSLSSLDRRDNVDFAVSCTARALDALSTLRANDPRVVAALQGARAWLSEETFKDDLEALVAGATAAAEEVDEALQGREADPISARAMDAAYAASNAATAANEVQPDFPVWASYAAKHALSCSDDYLAEATCQTNALVALLLTTR